MNEDRVVQVNLSYSLYGCPLFEPSKGSVLSLELFLEELPVDVDGEAMRQVLIQGNRGGLKALAAALLSVAEAHGEHKHIHIDKFVYGDVYKNKDDLTLTISLIPGPSE